MRPRHRPSSPVAELFACGARVLWGGPVGPARDLADDGDNIVGDGVEPVVVGDVDGVDRARPRLEAERVEVHRDVHGVDAVEGEQELVVVQVRDGVDVVNGELPEPNPVRRHPHLGGGRRPHELLARVRVVPGVRVHVVACVDRHVLGDLESIVVRGVIEDDVKVRCGHEAAHVTLRTVACTWENC